MSSSEIRLSNGFKPLLPSCVPDLHFYLHILHFNCLNSEIHPDCGDVIDPELLLYKSEEDVRFADCSVADNDGLGQVVILSVLRVLC